MAKLNSYGNCAGANGNLWSTSNQRSAQIDSGATRARYQHMWASIEKWDGVGAAPANGDTPATNTHLSYDWTITDDYTKTCASDGTFCDFAVQNGPTWHQEHLAIDNTTNVPPAADAATFTTAMLNRIKSVGGVLNSLEVANEGFNAAVLTAGNAPQMFNQMAALLKSIRTAAKAVMPNILIGAPAELNKNGTNIDVWTNAFFAAGCHKQVDYVNFHFYPGGAPDNPNAGNYGLKQWLAAWQNAMKTAKVSLPIHITEWGWKYITVGDANYNSYLTTFMNDVIASNLVQAVYIFDMDSIVPARHFNDAATSQTYKTFKNFIAKTPNFGPTASSGGGGTVGGGGGSGGGTGGTGGSSQPTVFLTNTASTQMPAANQLYITPGTPTVANANTQVGTATGYGEITSQGTTANWANAATLPAPTGKGFLLDPAILNLSGQEFNIDAWTTTVTMNLTGAGAAKITGTLSCRAFIRSSAGHYTPLASMQAANQTWGLQSNQFTLTDAPKVTTPFQSGDQLYLDLWVNVTTNTGTSAQQFVLKKLSTDTSTKTGDPGSQVVMPAYQSATGGGGAGPYGNTVLGDGPIRYYRMDASTGTAEADLGSQLQNATITGGVTLARSGLINNDPDTCMYFDPMVGGYLTVPVTGLPTGAGAWTIEAWVEMPTLPTSGYAPIFAMGTTGANGNMVGLYYNATANTFTVTGNTSDIVTSSTAVTNATIYYVAATYDGTTMKIYVNGGTPNSVSFTATVTQGTNAYIANDVAAHQGSGYIDEVALYSSALTSTQILAHYNAGKGATTTGGGGTGGGGTGGGTVGGGTGGGPTPTGVAIPYSVTINGVPQNVLASTLHVESTIGKRSTASFTIWTDNNTHFQQYEQVAIYDQHNILTFSGYITQPQEYQPGFAPYLLHTITCCDQHYLADKRVVAASYTNKTCGYIAQDLVNNILSQEGVTFGLIYDGIVPNTNLYPSRSLFPGGNIGTIPQATFVYCTVAQAFDELVKAASSAGVPYYWMIDQNEQIWFVPYTAVVNNTLVDGTQIEQTNTPATVTRQNPSYRNTQYITGGTAQTVQQVETRKGDGNTVAWAMGYGLASVPTITVNSTAKQVGIKGLDTGKDFYWAKGDPVITQDSSATKLVSTDTLQVTYFGQYPTIIVASNGAQITYQASIDGSTGIVEQVIDDKTVTSASIGQFEAGQLLSRYGIQATQLTFTTLQYGFAPGQLITVNLPMHGLLNQQMLIEKVIASDQQDSLNIRYDVTAVAGPYDITWVDFFSQLLAQSAPANSINIGASTALVIAASFTASLTPTVTLSSATYACPLPATSLQPGTGVFPC